MCSDTSPSKIRPPFPLFPHQMSSSEQQPATITIRALVTSKEGIYIYNCDNFSWFCYWQRRLQCQKGNFIPIIIKFNRYTPPPTTNHDLTGTLHHLQLITIKVRVETLVKAAVSRSIPNVNERILSVTGTPQQVGDAFGNCTILRLINSIILSTFIISL